MSGILKPVGSVGEVLDGASSVGPNTSVAEVVLAVMRVASIVKPYCNVAKGEENEPSSESEPKAST